MKEKPEMRIWKRALSLLLVLALLVSMAPGLVPRTPAATQLSLEQLMAKYPSGKYWNHYVKDESQTTAALCDRGDESFAEYVSDYPCSHHEESSANSFTGGYSCNYYSNGFQCHGFAKWMAFAAYGSRAADWEMGTLDTLKPGDVVHYRGGGSGDVWGHWVFVIEVSGSTITVGECNWGGNCLINWGRSFDLAQTGSYEIYSAPYALGTRKVSPMISHWIAATDMGDATGYIGRGEWAYLCYRLYDKETGKPLNEVVDYQYTAKLTICMPDGTQAHTYTFQNTDESWISVWRNVLGTYTYTVTLSGDLNGTFTGKFQVYDQDTNLLRLAGANRFETAFKVADALQAERMVTEFETIIVASGLNFADALSGSYLASVKDAPILLSYDDTYNEQVKQYIRDNLQKGGTVYILGGTAAVPASMEQGLEDFRVKRLAGANRFETNLAILKEAGVGSREILVCTGTNFADSLSASATGLPILLVYNESRKLTQGQMEFLSELVRNDFCVIGGESAVGRDLYRAIGKYGDISRLSGTDRFQTSVLVAQRYFDAPTQAVLAYAWNYTDGLCGGSLAYAMGAPLILTMTGYESQASGYVRGMGIAGGVVLGGEKLISTDAVNSIYDIREGCLIINK